MIIILNSIGVGRIRYTTCCEKDAKVAVKFLLDASDAQSAGVMLSVCNACNGL
ncbi:hypothetical protein ABIE13_003398 [Ottowia thiooxydans]|uniref:Uncharacterized protein n=1 Tax=Ottowia thiooxydans TaxID=219182 RepID=A0ABV2QB65_9BURK